MRLDFIRSLYEERGPFASVYMPTNRITKAVAVMVGLRWRHISEGLAEAGAPDEVIARIGEFVGDPAPGRAVFCSSSGVIFSEPLAAGPEWDIARWSALPHVMPLLAQRGERVPYMQVVVDHLGADVIVLSGGERRELVVQAEDWPIHKPAQGGRSQPRYERDVEETWRRNAVATAEVIAKEAVQSEAELIVLGGDPKSRHMVLDRLGRDVAQRVVVAENGGRSPGEMPKSYLRKVDEALRSWLVQRQNELVDAYRNGPAVSGLHETARALRVSQVAKVLVAEGPSYEEMVWIGPEGPQFSPDREEMCAWGVADPINERADAALARAVATTDAELWFVPELDSPEGVGAILRF
ncbi:hypothetical protein Aple_070020 [Acrocarpospora pleiomorpha]|uniref:Peptide chain release factor 1 n=1 Tax=Acrocarpospora pleiomorpha TaxID=90975 RepID=A0A5M3XXF7_9ACTN|nr:Vms1/Ankzf1 family peptidyl-tRNA hydrolase [Acrocarpospora pleiomorpha]GES24103.1 hypothetical protein Aple_070020 [Acrocarpospora pleiomorpha]